MCSSDLVKVGSSARGFRQALDPHRTQYVLLGGSAISVPTFRFWFYVHVLAGPALLVGAGYLAGWRLVGLGAGRNDDRQLEVAAPARPEIGWSD